MRLFCAIGAFLLVTSCGGGEARLRRLLQQTSGTVDLPAGEFELSSELAVPDGARDLEILGASSGTLLHASARFNGRALLRIGRADRVRITGISFDGNRDVLEKRAGLPPSDVPFARHFSGNGILADRVEGLSLSDVTFRNIAGFAILVSRSSNVVIHGAEIRDSGSRNEKGRNNTTGGILLEEGVTGFEVRYSVLRDVRGNGIWTHSNYASPRNRDGVIARNRFWNIGRDAIQIGHAVNVRVEDNVGTRIGYPVDEVDTEGGGTPVGIDTAGNVENSVYVGNRFEEINGKCIDLDGFHHGEVRRNTCVNRGGAADYPFGHYGIVFNNANPDMESTGILVSENTIDGTKFGGIFVIGTGHRIIGNNLRSLNLAGCNESAATYGCSHFPGEPDLLQAGIYLGRRAERPALARDNVIEANEISGHKMSSRCVLAAPGVSLAANRVVANRCADSPEGR